MESARRPLVGLMGLAMLCCSATSSRADAIDGNWCHADGRRLTIRGPQIATPGGAKMSGDYARHSFHYVVPAGEPGTGETVSMVLLSEYLMHARQGASDAPVQVWNRCPPEITELRRIG
ncbi:MAG: hypothetical protein ACJ8FU_13680 [Xanthobacteraceae bacterium]